MNPNLTQLSKLDPREQVQQLASEQTHLAPLFFGTRGANVRNRATRDRSEELISGVLSDAPKTLRFLADLESELNHSFTPERDNYGVMSETALPGDFSAVRTVTGYGMDPMTIPPTNNTVLRDSMQLARGFLSERHQKIFEQLCSCIFADREPGGLHIRRDASSCFPHFTTEPDRKADMFRRAAKVMPTVHRYFEQDRLPDLLRDEQMLLAYYIGVRSQWDKVSTGTDGKRQVKPRMVNDLLYALTGGEQGQRFEAERNIVRPDGSVIDGFFRRRRRTVYGMSGTFNYYMTAVFDGWRRHYTKMYEATYKHRGADDIKRKLSRYSHFIGVDVKEHDQATAYWLVDAIISQVGKHTKPWFEELLRRAFKAPLFCPNPYIGEAGGVWLGSPLDAADFTNWPGLTSGIAPNPDIGKIQMTFVDLIVLDDYFKDVLEFGVDRILKHEHPLYALLNMSDDGVFMTNSVEFFKHLNAKYEKGEAVSQYMKLEKEDSLTFLGNVFYRDAKEKLEVCPNIVSYILNWWAPESGITARKRKFWMTGWFARQEIFRHAPLFKEVNAVLDSVFYQHFHVYPDTLVHKAVEKEVILASHMLNTADQIVLMKPDAIHYLVDPSELSPNLRDEVLTTLPESEVEPLIAGVFQ